MGNQFGLPSVAYVLRGRLDISVKCLADLPFQFLSKDPCTIPVKSSLGNIMLKVLFKSTLKFKRVNLRTNRSKLEDI